MVDFAPATLALVVAAAVVPHRDSIPAWHYSYKNAKRIRFCITTLPIRADQSPARFPARSGRVRKWSTHRSNMADEEKAKNRN
jgi:hypothetical protein